MIRKKIRQTGIFLFWLLIWQTAALIIDNDILFAAPGEVLYSLAAQIGKAEFWKICLISLSRIFFGSFLAFLMAVLLGAASYRFPFVGELLTPVMLFSKSVPVASFVILALIWAGSKNLSIIIAFVVVLPIIYASTLSGLENTDKKLLEMAAVFRFSIAKKIKAIYIPSLIPYIISGAGTALGMGIKSGVAAEVIGVPASSMGEQLYLAKIYLDTASLFSWTLVIIVAAWLFERLIMGLLKTLDPESIKEAHREDNS